MIELPNPCVCLVTDRRAAAPGARSTEEELTSLEAVLAQAIDAGIDLIQVRERDLEANALREFVSRIVSLSRGSVTRIIVNDRADVALAANADGVHLRADGPPAQGVRELMGPDRAIGRSIHSARNVDQAADYLLFGTVFPSESKPPGSPVAGLGALAEAVQTTNVPILAIGGLSPDRAAACRAAGAAGIAAIRAFLPATGTRDAIHSFRRAMR